MCPEAEIPPERIAKAQHLLEELRANAYAEGYEKGLTDGIVLGRRMKQIPESPVLLDA